MPIPLSTPILVTLACSTLLLTAAPVAQRFSRTDDESYYPVATQTERAAGRYGYTAFPDFPHLNLVQQGTGEPNRALTALIRDRHLRQLIEAKTFGSLQVRNFAPRYPGVIATMDSFIIPFTISLEQSANVLQWGTLDLSGTLTVRTDGTKIVAVIRQYWDSTGAERLARLYWLHQRDDLSFASAIAEPILTHWLTEDPARLASLLDEAQRVDAPSQP
jgi:hypothetical protein